MECPLPKGWERVACFACDGHGMVSNWGEPDECATCGGCGCLYRHINFHPGVLVECPGGRFV